MSKILVTGSLGQIGSELVPALQKKVGKDNVVGLDIREPKEDIGPFVNQNTTEREGLKAVLKDNDITQIYHLCSILSAKGELRPWQAWHVNMDSMRNVLALAVDMDIKKIFWPSSIAVFGPTSPRNNTPQKTIIEPTTMYGVTKMAGEGLCNYYFHKYGMDIRSLRYPGLISYKAPPGGGTTDYAVAVFYEALKSKNYSCFVSKDTVLPMMYMDDAIRGTLELMEADKSKLSVKTSYNMSALSFSAEDLTKEIQKHVPDLKVTYEPDERQKIADSWPQVIDDSRARKDWDWKHEFDLPKLTKVMLEKLGEKFAKEKS
ncbi:NAD-dependent epimerase/dehydratase family protein [Candidatus Woesearchaeota archaeon]|nr:NAD-dependent epimerase/dehydratase family protein [Candidatus Woesearchaeota archaeon]